MEWAMGKAREEIGFGVGPEPTGDESSTVMKAMKIQPNAADQKLVELQNERLQEYLRTLKPGAAAGKP